MAIYRRLGRDEIIRPGDQFRDWENKWATVMGSVGDTPKDLGFEYRRPVSQLFPQWEHPEAPSVPVHVLWAETPVGTPTVASSAAVAKPEPSKSIPEPGEGYRLLGPDEKFAAGDECKYPRWYKVTSIDGRTAILFIFEKNGELFTLNGGSNGYGSWDTSFNERVRVTESEAQAELDEWDSVFNDYFEG